MPAQNIGPKPIAFVRELCKNKTETEILEAEENFRQYLLLVKRICERIEHEEATLVQVDKSEKYCDSESGISDIIAN